MHLTVGGNKNIKYFRRFFTACEIVAYFPCYTKEHHTKEDDSSDSFGMKYSLINIFGICVTFEMKWCL